jgi:hypothetical protein
MTLSIFVVFLTNPKLDIVRSLHPVRGSISGSRELRNCWDRPRRHQKIPAAAGARERQAVSRSTARAAPGGVTGPGSRAGDLNAGPACSIRSDPAVCGIVFVIIGVQGCAGPGVRPGIGSSPLPAQTLSRCSI